MFNNKGFGKQIQEERKRKGLSLDKLGEMIGVSRQTLSKWEKGEGVGPTVFELLELCNIFECDYGFLVGEYDCHRRPETDIKKEIGLPESSILSLKEINNQDDKLKEAVFYFLDSLFDWSLLPSLAIRLKEYLTGSTDNKVLSVIDEEGNSIGTLPQDIAYLLLKADFDLFLSFAKSRRNTVFSNQFNRDFFHKLSEEQRAELIADYENGIRRGK